MNIFKIWRGYRKFGISYGLPFFFVDTGPGVSYDPMKVIEKLRDLGLDTDMWVAIRGNALREQGMGTLVTGLKYCKVKIEVEENGTNLAPGWFPQVDRWLVDWIENSAFNYKALRPRQDLLIYKGEDIYKFLEKSKNCQALRVVITNEDVWDAIKNYNIRVYPKEAVC